MIRYGLCDGCCFFSLLGCLVGCILNCKRLSAYPVGFLLHCKGFCFYLGCFIANRFCFQFDLFGGILDGKRVLSHLVGLVLDGKRFFLHPGCLVADCFRFQLDLSGRFLDCKRFRYRTVGQRRSIFRTGGRPVGRIRRRHHIIIRRLYLIQ